jgi:Flp pilus assembly protein TadD
MQAAARYYHARDYVEAERCCRELLARDAAHFDALHLLGVIHFDRSQLTEAVEYLTGAVALHPADPLVNYHLGTALLGQKQYALAEPPLRRAATGHPNDAGVLNNLGNALIGLGRHEDALLCFQRVLGMAPFRAAAHYNMGRALAALDRPDEAVASFQAALVNSPAGIDRNRIADVHAGLGQALADQGCYDEAITACRTIEAIHPGIAAWNESLVLLLLGRFAEGWRKYESRWQVPDHDTLRADARVPALDEVAGKRVLLLPEQGQGDLIQFARYAPMLAAHGAHVTLQSYTETKALMATLQGIDAVITPDDPEPPADIVTPLLSLPLVFGTDLGSIPASVPYLRPPKQRLAAWRKRLGRSKPRRVGLVWWGSQHIPKRSLPFPALQPLLSLDDIEFHALQKEIPATHAALLARHTNLIDHRDELTDFADTAALISLLDLVVTIDTSVAHLAGALGKPVWIMLHCTADWRWLRDRADSPWYPSARLFRQRRRGDWLPVVSDVADALRVMPRPASARM